MHQLSTSILLIIALAPLAGAVLAGFLGRRIGRVGSHTVTILGVGIACALSFYVLYQLVWGGAANYNHDIYTWFQVGKFNASVGFMIDRLSAMMMVVVTFVSLMVHVYTIGYMADDDGYQRFFSYIALFTFSMLMLVMSNNFMQLFFGWEGGGPGLVPADRFLVQAPERDLRQPQGLPGQPRGRFRLRAGHRRGAVLPRHARLPDRLRRMRRPWSARRCTSPSTPAGARPR